MTPSYLVLPDDDATRFPTVWLGPNQYTLPVHARYSAWGLWFVLSLLLMPLFYLAFSFTGLLWAQCFSILATRFLMLAVDNDLPLGALHTVLRAEVRAYSRPVKPQTFGVSLATLRVRSLGLPTPPPEFTP